MSTSELLVHCTLICDAQIARLQLDEYQEQSFLLDPSLEAMVSPLVAALRASLAYPPSTRQAHVSKLLYWITKVRGSKAIGERIPILTFSKLSFSSSNSCDYTARFLSHDVGDLSMLVALLSSRQPNEIAATSWETRYVLLLWLSVCVRQPFAFERLAPGADEDIVAVGLDGLKGNGKAADAAADLLGWFYARNDVDLQPLLRLCEKALASDAAGTEVRLALNFQVVPG